MRISKLLFFKERGKLFVKSRMLSATNHHRAYRKRNAPDAFAQGAFLKEILFGSDKNVKSSIYLSAQSLTLLFLHFKSSRDRIGLVADGNEFFF